MSKDQDDKAFIINESGFRDEHGNLHTRRSAEVDVKGKAILLGEEIVTGKDGKVLSVETVIDSGSDHTLKTYNTLNDPHAVDKWAIASSGESKMKYLFDANFSLEQQKAIQRVLSGEGVKQSDGQELAAMAEKAYAVTHPKKEDARELTPEESSRFILEAKNIAPNAGKGQSR